MLPLIEFDGVTKRYASFTAVDDLSFVLEENTTLGLVGESGCGKTTTANLLLGLLAPSSGQIRFRGQDIAALHGAERKQFRRQVQMVFQDAKASLNPKRCIRQSVAEPLHNYERLSRTEEERQVTALLEDVGLDPACMEKYPGDLSGGQRQRVAIARALALRPKLIILDEATSNLDVSIQAQILNLLRRLKESYSASYLIISHDLGLVRYMSDRILVMKDGRVVEQLDPERLSEAKELYTRRLVDAIPDIHARMNRQNPAVKSIYN